MLRWHHNIHNSKSDWPWHNKKCVWLLAQSWSWRTWAGLSLWFFLFLYFSFFFLIIKLIYSEISQIQHSKNSFYLKTGYFWKYYIKYWLKIKAFHPKTRPSGCSSWYGHFLYVVLWSSVLSVSCLHQLLSGIRFCVNFFHYFAPYIPLWCLLG